MLEDVLDVQSWNEPGYRSLVFPMVGEPPC